MAKIGEDEVKNQLKDFCTGGEKPSDKIAEEILTFIAGSDSFENTLDLMKKLTGANEEAQENSAEKKAFDSIIRLKEIRAMMEASGIQNTFS